jgi:hypothetical protein
MRSLKLTTNKKDKMPSMDDAIAAQPMSRIEKGKEPWTVVEISPEEAAKRPPLEDNCCVMCTPPGALAAMTGLPAHLVKPDPYKMSESASRAQMNAQEAEYQFGSDPVNDDD